LVSIGQRILQSLSVQLLLIPPASPYSLSAEHLQECRPSSMGLCFWRHGRRRHHPRHRVLVHPFHRHPHQADG
jgi:hypothetical protein